MNEFLLITLSYPTVIFTVLLGVTFVYWTLVIVGAIGIDVLDVDVEADGVAEGAAEAAAEGAAEAAAEAAAEGAAEGVADGAASGGAFHALLNALRLRNAPLTFVLSLVFFWSWFFTHMGSLLVAPVLSFLPGTVVGTGIAAAALVAAFPMTSLCVAPLGRLFKQERQTRREDLIGKVVRISTGRVDGSFGTAAADDGGAGLILQVRCDADNELRRGDKALILAWDTAREAYEVTAMDDVLPPRLLPEE